MKTLVVGYGSIGKRHARLLAPLSDELALVTQQAISDFPCYKTIQVALEKMQPDYVVICSATAQHATDMVALKTAGYTGKVLVEKPIFNDITQSGAPYPFTVYVGYQLRFHVVVAALKKALEGKRLQSARGYVGQHLSQWRPDRDVKETYSAHRTQGGGVMRDLSHELDLAQFLFGEVTAHSGVAQRKADVTVDSEDSADFKLACTHCPDVQVHMNYLDEKPTRYWQVQTGAGEIYADLIAKTLTIVGTPHAFSCEADDAYITMHKAALADAPEICHFAEGMNVMQIIEAVEW